MQVTLYIYSCLILCIFDKLAVDVCGCMHACVDQDKGQSEPVTSLTYIQYHECVYIHVFRYSMQRSRFLQKQLHTLWQGESKRSSITCSTLGKPHLCWEVWSVRTYTCQLQPSRVINFHMVYLSNCVASVFSPVAGCIVYSAYSNPGIQRWHYGKWPHQPSHVIFVQQTII